MMVIFSLAQVFVIPAMSLIHGIINMCVGYQKPSAKVSLSLPHYTECIYIYVCIASTSKYNCLCVCTRVCSNTPLSITMHYS